MQKNQVVADLLRNLVGDDGQCGDDTELRALEKGRGDQDAIDEIVEGVADQDQQPRAPVIVRRRLRVVGFAMVVVEMPLQHQLLENEEHQDAEEDGCRHALRLPVLQRVWQDLQESGPQQGADRIGNQHIDAMRADRESHGGGRQDAD